MAQRAQGATLEVRVSNIYRLLVERGSAAGFTEEQVRREAASQLAILEPEADRSSSRAETPPHLGCLVNPCTECAIIE